MNELSPSSWFWWCLLCTTPIVKFSSVENSIVILQFGTSFSFTGVNFQVFIWKHFVNICDEISDLNLLLTNSMARKYSVRHFESLSANLTISTASVFRPASMISICDRVAWSKLKNWHFVYSRKMNQFENSKLPWNFVGKIFHTATRRHSYGHCLGTQFLVYFIQGFLLTVSQSKRRSKLIARNNFIENIHHRFISTELKIKE